MRASVRSFLVGLGAVVAVFALPGAAEAGDPDSLRQLAAPCVTRSLQQTTPMLSELLTCLEGAAGLEADTARAWAGRQLQAADRALAAPSTQALLASRWAASKETYQVETGRGVKYLQALSKELTKALDSGRNYSVQSLLEKAGGSARLPGTQLRPALLAAVDAAVGAAVGSAPATVAVARDTVDELQLAVLSGEVMDVLPTVEFHKTTGLLDRAYGPYWFLLPRHWGEEGPTTHCDVFFLTPRFRLEVWDLAATQLTKAGVCRRVLESPPGRHAGVSLLKVYATLQMAEARHGPVAVLLKGGWRIEQDGPTEQLSQRTGTPRTLKLLLQYYPPDATGPSWWYWSMAAVSVPKFGHNPDPQDDRPRFPEQLEYVEPIIEDVLIEKLRGSL